MHHAPNPTRLSLVRGPRPQPRSYLYYASIRSTHQDSVAAKDVPSPPLLNSWGAKIFGHAAEMQQLAKQLGVRPSMAMRELKGKWYEQVGQKTMKLNMPGGTVLVMSSDPELFKEVLVNKQDAFTNSLAFKIVFGEFFPTSAIVVDGDQWQRIRKVLTRAIGRQDLDQIVPIMVESGDTMLARADVNTAQTYDLMNRVTFDAFHRTMYGWDPHTLQNNPATVGLLDACNTIANTIGERAFLPFPILWRLPTKTNRDATKALHTIQNFVQNFVIQEKKRMSGNEVQTSRTRFDSLLDGMLNANDPNDGDAKLTDQELYDQLSTLFFGAYDTTSNTLMFVNNYLALYPEEQEKVRAAVKAKFPDTNALRASTLADVESINEVKWFVEEVNRLHAIAAAFSRTATRDVEIAGYQFKAGTQFIIDHSTTSRDATYWQKANPAPSEADMHQFRPSRWGEFKPAALSMPMPFGAGSRICPGRKIALSEMRSFLARILLTHRVEQRVRGEPWELDSTIAMGFKTGKGNINFVPLSG